MPYSSAGTLRMLNICLRMSFLMEFILVSMDEYFSTGLAFQSVYHHALRALIREPNLRRFRISGAFMICCAKPAMCATVKMGGSDIRAG